MESSSDIRFKRNAFEWTDVNIQTLVPGVMEGAECGPCSVPGDTGVRRADIQHPAPGPHTDAVSHRDRDNC